jgi:hypothetical protein
MDNPMGFTLNMFHSAENLAPTLCSHHSVNLCVIQPLIETSKRLAPIQATQDRDQESSTRRTPNHRGAC